MANDTFQILRSSVPLLRPQDRCPGEIYVNFADRIFGVIDAAGVPQDIGPLVFQTVAALAAYDAAVAPPLGVLAFAADAFYLKETGGTAPGLPGWRELALGGGGYDDTELRALIAAETQNRIDGDNALGSLLGSLEVVVDDNNTALNARVSSESQARVQGDTALATRIDNIEAGGGTDLTPVFAAITEESLARVAGDEALAQQILTLEASVTDGDSALDARITVESEARVLGDEALASRTTTLEVFRTDAQQSGANMLQNALFTLGDEPWDFLGSNGWAIEPRDIGPSQYALVTRAPGTVRANNGDYLPSPSQQLNFEVWVERAPGTVGTVTARLELANAVGQPIPALTELLDAPEGLNTRLILTFKLPEQAGLWRLAFVSDVSVGSIDLRAPFLGLRGQDFSAEIDSLGARITDESAVRLAGDTALAERSSVLEAFRTSTEQTGGNLIDDAALVLGGGAWVFGGWFAAPRSNAPAAQVFAVDAGVRTLRANGGLMRSPVLQQFTLRLWFLENPSTTGVGLTIRVRISRPGVADEILTDFVLPVTGVFLAWRPHAFVVNLPDDTIGWRVEFISNITQGRLEMALPFAGVSTGDNDADVAALNARISDESLARIAGDTALATRSSALEARSRALESAETPFDFGAYPDIATLIAAGFEANPPLTDPAWFIGPDGYSEGGRTLGYRAPTTRNMFLMGPRVAFNPTWLETYSGRWQIFRSTDGADPAAPIEVFAGWVPYDANNQQLVPSDFGSFHNQVSAGRELFPGEISVFGYGRGTAELGSLITGRPSPNISDPAPFRTGTTSLRPVMQLIGVPANTTIFILNGRYGIVTRAAENSASITTVSARITDESVARVAGDTALASRSSVLEAASLQSRSDAQNINFGAYKSIEEMVAAGWEFNPPITHPGIFTPFAWSLTPAFGDGGQALKFWGAAQTVTLRAPMTLVSGNPWQPETHQASWVMGRDADANRNPDARFIAGWECFDVNGLRLDTDAGGFSGHAGLWELLPHSMTLVIKGYARGMETTGTGANVGGPAPDILSATPLPSFAARFRPVFQLQTSPQDPTTPLFLWFFRVDYRRVSNERATRAAITNESTVRADADNALAQQIQQIIATGGEGAQTFFQPNAPANPEPGWLWFQDTGPGVPDNIFRWDGITWVRIDTAQQNDISALQAQISDESLARVVGDAALASRATTLEAVSVAQGNAIDDNADELVVTNARINTEAQARVQGDNALALRSSNIETSVGGLTARVVTTEESIDGIEARYTVVVNAQGRIAGISLVAGGDASLFDILADAMRVFNPITGTDEPVFIVQNGRVFIREAFIPLLGTSSLKIDDVVLDTNAEGELTIRQQGITTSLLAQNAAVRPYTFFGQGSWTVNPRNTWIAAQIAGRTAQLTIINPPTATGFLEIVLVFGASNAGNSADAMGFRIQRSDGVFLPQVYTNCEIAETFGRNDMRTLHFFDEGVPAGQTLTYTLQVTSDDGSFVRSITLLGKLFKNASAAVGASA